MCILCDDHKLGVHMNCVRKEFDEVFEEVKSRGFPEDSEVFIAAFAEVGERRIRALG